MSPRIRNFVILLLMTSCLLTAANILITTDAYFTGFTTFNQKLQITPMKEAVDFLRDANIPLINPQINRLSHALDSLQNQAAISSWQTIYFNIFMSSLTLISLIAVIFFQFHQPSQHALFQLMKKVNHKQADNFDAKAMDALSHLAEDMQLLCRRMGETIKEEADKLPQTARNDDKHQLMKLITHVEDLGTQLARAASQATHLKRENSDIGKKIISINANMERDAGISSQAKVEANIINNQSRLIRQEESLKNEVLANIEKMIAQLGAGIESSSKNKRSTLAILESMHHELNQLLGQVTKCFETFSHVDHAIADCGIDVKEASSLVTLVSHRAEEIISIIDVIDDIAEQTNLLALNASIEAARAGEQGQGFAVVAEEVRKLAARSSNATRNITELLTTIKSEAKQASEGLEKSKSSVLNAQKTMDLVSSSYQTAQSSAAGYLNSFNQLVKNSEKDLEQLGEVAKTGSTLSSETTSLTKSTLELTKHRDLVMMQFGSLISKLNQLNRNLVRSSLEISYLEQQVEFSGTIYQQQEKSFMEFNTQGKSLRQELQQLTGFQIDSGNGVNWQNLTRHLTHMQVTTNLLNEFASVAVIKLPEAASQSVNPIINIQTTDQGSDTIAA